MGRKPTGPASASCLALSHCVRAQVTLADAAAGSALDAVGNRRSAACPGHRKLWALKRSAVSILGDSPPTLDGPVHTVMATFLSLIFLSPAVKHQLSVYVHTRVDVNVHLCVCVYMCLHEFIKH